MAARPVMTMQRNEHVRERLGKRYTSLVISKQSIVGFKHVNWTQECKWRGTSSGSERFEIRKWKADVRLDTTAK